jgi:hypothetical protein
VSVARFASVLRPLGAPWELRLRVAGVRDEWPAGGPSGWVPLPVLLGQLLARHRAAVAREGDPRRQAADLLPWSVAIPASAYVLPALLADVLPVVASGHSGSDWLLHEHPDGRVDGVALPAGTQGSPSPTRAEVAGGVVALVDPWLRRLCPLLPITERTAWGGVVDTLTGGVMAAARDGLGASPDVVWRRLQRLVDELERVVPLPGRPRRVDVAYAAGTAVFPVRSTCCLYYRSHPAPERDGEGYCVTCPLRTEGSRHRRLAAYLDQLTDTAS